MILVMLLVAPVAVARLEFFFWNDVINLDVFGYSEYHIDATVSCQVQDDWRLTCIYGEAQVNKRYMTWDLLKCLVSASPLPWVSLGDFNEVSPLQEKKDTSVTLWPERKLFLTWM